MKKLLTLAAAAVAACAMVVTPAGAITGNYVDDNEHPFVGLVAFYDEEGNFLWRCSGSLLTDRVFLTAGHCTEQGDPEGDVEPALARIWFHQNVGGAYNPPDVPEDPNTGYPNRCLPDDPLCVEATLLFDFGFADFRGFPNTQDLGLIILPEDEAVELSEYGQLAGIGYLDSLATQRGRQDVTFTVSGYGVSRINPVQFESFRERLMAQSRLVNLRSALTGGFNLQTSANAGGGRGGTCFGDSGGPVFYGDWSSNLIVGVTSFGLNGNCRGVDFAFRVDTAAVHEWLFGILAQYAPEEIDEIEIVEAG